MPFISLKDAYKVYGEGEGKTTALSGVSLDIEAGEFVVILGSSGAGKTTLLNILGGMDCLSSGSYVVDGEEIGNYNGKKLELFRRRKIGFVFQFYNLMPNLTALENVQLAEGITKNAMDSLSALNLVGLENKAGNFPSQLSGGEQQRVSIARAIVKNPALLLCDEPTGALDSKTGAAALNTLKTLSESQNCTAVIVTHNSLIAEIASRVIRLQDGKIVGDTKTANPKKAEELVW